MFIYKLVNDVNHKIYVGKTEKSVEERFRVHCRNAEKRVNRYLYDAMNHYGYEHFHWYVLEKCQSRKRLDLRERYWIRKLGSLSPDVGYNMQEGGLGGKHNAETLARIGKKVSLANKGHLVSIETRRKISLAHIGLKHSEATKKKLSEYCKRIGRRPPIVVRKGKDHPMFGKFHTAEARKKIGLARLGKTYVDIYKDPVVLTRHLLRCREHWLGDKNPQFKRVDPARIMTLMRQGKQGQEICAILGISEPTLISKFKTAFGMVPSQYRKQFIKSL